jgi:hypothetical protein
MLTRQYSFLVVFVARAPPMEEEERELPEEGSAPVTEEKRFVKLIRRMEPWYAATAYAYHKCGAAQLFNFHMDRKKVRDGDVMVYVGSKSKELAESFSHMYDIEVLSAKELRKLVNREKIIPLWFINAVTLVGNAWGGIVNMMTCVVQLYNCCVSIFYLHIHRSVAIE